MIKNINKKILLLFTIYVIPFVVKAQDFVPLSPSLPNGISMQQAGNQGFTNLLNGLFGISIAVAAILAVIMLAIGGFKYMTSDSVFKVGGAKEQITNAIIGLIIVLASVIILSVINPEIVSLRLFQIS